MEVKCIMKLIRSCIVSFSMYSKIPMPQFKWNDDDMKYMLVFFPWIGAVIGLLLMLGDIYTLISEWRISAMYA